MASPSRRAIALVWERILGNRVISPNRLIDGGAAMLAADIINHQKEREGKSIIIPLDRYILRVFVASYLMLARANIAGEQRPWASIIIMAPFHPQTVLDSRPAVRRPMCPTEL